MFIRLDPDNNDEAVDLDRDEFLRLGYCINDLMDNFSDPIMDVDAMLANVRKSYPYYNPHKGDTMNGRGGFSGNRGFHVTEDGTVIKDPENMQIVPSFIIKPRTAEAAAQ